MANTIQIKRGTGTSEPSNLAEGELAINLDSGKLFYGSGSSVLSDFKVNTLTAETYVVSSSVTHMTTSFSSGSTAFGDSTGDTHTFTGNITASGDISASGIGTFNRLDVAEYIYHEDDNTYIRFLPDRIIAVAGNNSVLDLRPGTSVKFGHTSEPTIIQGSTLTLTGDVTASGNISSSGTITANAFVGNITGDLTGEAATVATIAGLAPNTATTQATQGAITSLGTLTGLNVNSHITASGNISASGILYGDSLYIDDQPAVASSVGEIFLAHGSLNLTSYAANNNFNSHITASGNISASGNIIATEFHGDGSNLTGLSGGTVGWHGSGTRIKILHSDFIADDGGRPAMIDDTGVASEELFLESYTSNKLYATIAIPTGYTATHVMIYGTDNDGSATDAVEVWEHQIDSKTGVSKGTGNVDTEIDIDNVASSTTNYLFIQVANASGNEIHGGYVTIAES